jgi:4-amino-4-deoxy-L-arabinose transferase-like glycosyltransferase
VTDSRATRLVVAALVVGLLARATFALVYWQDRPLTVDQVEYLMLADRLREGEGLTYPPGERRLMRSPGYPIFLAAVGSVVPGESAIRAVQCLLGMIAVLQVALMARRLGGARAGVLAAWIAALYPPLVFEPAYILTEPLYTVLALGCLWLTWNALDAPTAGGQSRQAAAAGLVAGAVVLVRPEFALFVGLAGLVLLARRRWTPALVLGVAAAVVVAPWPAYNALVHDRVIYLSSRGGPNFWMGNNALAVGDGDVASNPPMAHAYVRLMAEHPDLTAEALEGVFYQEAFAFIRDNPAGWLGLVARKAFWFVVPFGPSYQSRSAWFVASHAVSWLLLLGVSLAAWRAKEVLRPPPLAFTIAAASVVLTCLLFFPLERYRVPLLDPVLIACAGTLASRGRR